MNDIERILEEFSKAYGKRSERITERLRENLQRGQSVKEAIEDVFQAFDIDRTVKEATEEAIRKGAMAGVGAQGYALPCSPSGLPKHGTQANGTYLKNFTMQAEK